MKQEKRIMSYKNTLDILWELAGFGEDERVIKILKNFPRLTEPLTQQEVWRFADEALVPFKSIPFEKKEEGDNE